MLHRDCHHGGTRRVLKLYALSVLVCAGIACSSNEPREVTAYYRGPCEIPTPCGGPLSGKWSLTAACAAARENCGAELGSAKVVGDLEFHVDPSTGGLRVTWNDQIDYQHCRMVGSTTDNVSSAAATISGTDLVLASYGGHVTTTRSYPYCRSGDDLWIATPSAEFPKLGVRHYHRRD